MTGFRCFSFAFLFAFTGCAMAGMGSSEQPVEAEGGTQNVVSGTVVTGGSGGDRGSSGGVRRVPVFDAAPDVPCRYRSMGGVNGEITINEPAEFRTDMKRELGRLGALRGADAVIMAEDIEIPVTAGGGRDPVDSLSGRKIALRGMAIEYTEPCGSS